ncbi:MAG: ribonuclease P protein component [Alphaproteobacteria bacterium]
MPNSLTKLKKRSEFLFIRNEGSCIKTKFFIINYFHTEENKIKFGITISRKFGNSVCRNYVKRVIRSILAQNFNKYFTRIIFEIIPKKNIEKIKYQELENDLISNLKNLVI